MIIGVGITEMLLLVFLLNNEANLGRYCSSAAPPSSLYRCCCCTTDQSVTLILFISQRRNFTLAFQAAESVGIKCTLVSSAPPSEPATVVGPPSWRPLFFLLWFPGHQRYGAHREARLAERHDLRYGNLQIL